MRGRRRRCLSRDEVLGTKDEVRGKMKSCLRRTAGTQCIAFIFTGADGYRMEIVQRIVSLAEAGLRFGLRTVITTISFESKYDQ